jgi:hypothetical protein
MSIRRPAYLAIALALAGCATADRVPATVDIPVPVHCNPAVGSEPIYPDTDAALRAAPSLFERVRLLVEGRLMRIQREAELNAAIKACE